MKRSLFILFSLMFVVGNLYSASLTISTDIEVANLTIASGSTVTQSGTDLYISGNFTNDGTFTPGTNNVILNGTSQNLSGDISFYNLTKSVASSDVLTFGAGNTYTVTGTCALNGADSNLLSLRSSTDDTQWNISPAGTRSFSYLDVKDSNNSSGTIINVDNTGSIDSGNNTNWRFGPIYVDINATSGNNDGSSWADAYTSFQSALDVAVSGNRIWVAAGTYYPTKDVTGDNNPTDPRTKCFVMIEDVEIYGGFAGSETAISQRTDFNIGGTNETILSGDFNDDDVVTGEGETLTFENISENAYHVFELPSSLGLTTSAVLDGFTISGGYANSFSDNNSIGAGIYNNSNSPTFNYLNVIKNYAYSSGGGIYNDAGSPEISNSNISWNSNGESDTEGGGIANNEGTITITNSRILYNKSESGAGLRNYCNTSHLTNVIIAGNYAAGYAGGVYNRTSCTSNYTNVTITANTAESGGGGVLNWQGGSCTFNNSIVYGNTADRGAQIYLNGGATATMNYSCYGNDAGDIYYDDGSTFTATNNNITNDPLFVDVENGDYRIYGISPCADVGDNSYNSEEYDYRGYDFGRKLDKENHNLAGTIDMGAHEYKEGTDPLCLPFYMAKVSGSWSDTAIWFISETGGTDPDGYTTAVTEVPTADNSSGIIINADVTIASAKDTDITADQMTVNSGCTFTIESGATLTVADGDGTDLTVNGTLDINGTISIGTATVDIDGTLDATGGNVTFTDAGSLLISGTVTSLGTFTPLTSTITYDGGDQTILPLAYYGLSFAGSTSGSTKTFDAGTTSVETEILLTDDITLTGSSADNVTVQVTTPYAWDGTAGNSDATQSRVFNISAADKNVTLSNLTIKGGDISAFINTPSYGGCIYLEEGTLNVDTCVINGSKAYIGGGIFIANESVINVSNSTINNCIASNTGGGIYNNGETTTITSCTINGNSSDDTSGGIRNYGTMAIVNSTIFGNSCSNSGGAISNSSSATIVNSTITGNSAVNAGKGIYNSGSLYLTNNIITYNYDSDDNTYSSIGGGSVYGNYNISDYSFGSGNENIAYEYTSGMGATLFDTYTPIVENTIYQPVLADNGGDTKTVALSDESIALWEGVVTGSYDDSDTTRYAFSSDGTTWYSVEDGTEVYESVTKITTDQRGITRPDRPSFGSYDVQTAYYRSVAEGNWSNTSTWEVSNDEIIWAAATEYPTADNSDGISINSDVTIAGDVDANITVDQMTVNSGYTLIVDGTLTVDDGDGTDLTVDGTLDINGTISIGIATVDIDGTIDATGGNVTFTDAGSLLLSGTVTSLGTFTPLTSTVTYGGGDQTIFPTAYYDLSFTGSTSGSTKTFGDGTTSVGTEIVLTDAITLTGSSADNVTVQVTTPGEGGMESRVFNVDATGKTINLSNMTIKGGDISSLSYPNYYGGGIQVSAGTANFDCVNIINSKAGYGGGIYISNADCNITNSTISGTIGTIRGGGISISSGGTISNLTNSTISGNSCIDFGGGGIYVEGGTVSNLANCTISDNFSDYRGGGIFIFQEFGTSSITMLNSTISGNTATDNGDDICNSGGTLTTSNSIITDYYGSYGTLNDGGYNVVENSNLAVNDNGFDNITSILYNTKYNDPGTTYTSWTQGGIALETQTLNLSDTLAVNDTNNNTKTLALSSPSFAIAAIPYAAASNTWNNSPMTGGNYFDQRGVETEAGIPICVGAFSESFEPTLQASLIEFTNVKPYQMDVAWTRGDGNYCAVFMKENVSKENTKNNSYTNRKNITLAKDLDTATPENTVTYNANLAFGSGDQIGTSGWYCVYNGTADSVSVTNLDYYTSYIIHVCEYNGNAGAEMYDTDTATNNPNSQTTAIPPMYYRSVASGNWSDTSTWQGSLDETTWISALETPCDSSLGIVIRNENYVTVDTNVTIDQTDIEEGAILTIGSSYTLTLANGDGTDLVITGSLVNNGSITISDETDVWYLGSTNTIASLNYYNLTLGQYSDDVTKKSNSKENRHSSNKISKTTSNKLTYNYALSGNTEIRGNLTINTESALSVGSYNIAITGTTDDNGEIGIATGNVDANGTFDATDGYVSFTDEGYLYLGGTVTSLGTFTAATGNVYYDQTDDQTMDAVTYYNLFTDGSGTKTLNGDISINGNLTIAENTILSSNDYNITLGGNWTNDGSYTPGSNTVIFAGNGAQSVAGTNNFYNLTINNSGTDSVDASTGTLTVANNLSVTDGIFLSASDYENVIIEANGTLQLSGDITVSGNWSNAGTFDGGTYLVNFDGSDQTITGNSTFYDLKKNVTSAATLTFEHGDTTIVSHYLDLQGAENNRLALRSDSDGERWFIDVPTAKAANDTIAWLDIKDSDNIGAEIQAHHTNSIDSGNNTGWNFDYEPYVTTQAVTGILHFSATGNGTITDIGHPTPTQYGVCWSTETNPTIDDTCDFKTQEGATSTAGAFTSEMTGLDEGTTYYVRAYATNTVGTGYGDEVSFTTYSMPDFVYNSTTYTNGDSVDVSANEDSTLTFNLQVDDENSGETFSWDYSNVSHGSVSINNLKLKQSSGKFATKGGGSTETEQIVFTPDENYNGEATFTIEVGDGISSDTSKLIFNVTVDPINDPPVCTVDPVISGDLYVGKEINVSTGTWEDDKDVDNTNTGYTFNPTYTYQWQVGNDGTSFSNMTDSTRNSLVIPDTYYDKQLRCIVTCTDDGEVTPASQSTSAYSDTVTVLDSPPIFVYDGQEYSSGDSVAVETNEDTTLVFTLIAKDDNASQNFTWNYQDVTHGSVEINTPPKSLTTETKQIAFDPDSDYYGDASFVITVNDNVTKVTSNIKFNVTVNPINDPPVCTVSPVASGHLYVNDTLHVTTGTWNDEKDVNGTSYSWTLTYTYQWQKSTDGSTFADITGSTSNSFIIPDDYRELYVRCLVTATDDGVGTPATNDSTASSNVLQITNTAPVFVYNDTTYTSGSTIDIDAARNTDLIFNLMVHDDNAGEHITWSSQDVTHGTVSIDDVPTKDATEVTKQITFTPETNYLGYAGFTISVTDDLTDATCTLEFDLTIKPYHVYVDDDWTGYSYGDIVQDSLVFGQNAFLIANNAVEGVAPTGTIHVMAGTYDYGILVDKSLTMTTTEHAILSYYADRVDAALLIEEDDVTVTGFNFQDATDAIAALGENIVVTNCKFNNCTNGIINYGTDVIDAKRNWWGDLHGPSNPSNPNYAITTGSIVSDYVTFFPWNATTTVTDSSEYVTVYEPDAKLTIIAVSDVIQTGIDAAVDGNIVEVTDGTYTEDLTVDKAITLCSENGNTVTTIQQIDGIGISIGENADGFTLGGTDIGFTILAGNNTTQVIRIEGRPTNVSIIENVINIEGYAFEGISVNSVGSDSLTIQKNNITCDNGDSGIWLPNSSGAIISENSFSCSGSPISGWAIHLSGCTDPTISDNEIDNFNIGISLSCGAGFNDGLVDNNEIENCSHSIYISQWTPSGTFGTMQNIELSENTITTDQIAIYVGDGTYIDASTFVVQYNNLIAPSTKASNLSNKNDGKKVYDIQTKTTKESEYLYGFTVEELKVSGYGVYNAHSTEIVTAEDNWWDDQNGPYHDPNNTDTDGLNVSDNVDYRPWAIGNPAIDNIDRDMILTITSPRSVDSISTLVPTPFEVDFNETVHNFDKDTEISITGGYTNTPTITDEGNGLYTFGLIPEMDSSEMTVSIAAEVAEDIAGNYNQAVDITITFDAVISKYNIVITPASPYVDEYFDISLEAVDDYGYRDADYNRLARLTNNYPGFVDLINVMNLVDGFAETERAGISSEATDDLSITVRDYSTLNYETVLDSIVVQLAPIYPPTGHDGIGDPVVYDVPNDQGGWITLDYGLSPNDPFYPDPVQPYIYGYLVERNTEPDTSGTWEAFVQIECYYPNAAGNASALIPVPEDTASYPYRMSSLYIPDYKNTNQNDGPEITIVIDDSKDQYYTSSYVYCGSAAGLDNIPAYADIKVFLEGPYVADGVMSNDLYTAGLLPADAPSNAVDIITLELRSVLDSTSVQSTDAYLTTDGSIVNNEGGKGLSFFYTTGQDYYIVVHHRNHLDVITADTYVFGDTEAGATAIDLTGINSVYLNGFKEVESGVYAMYAGDASGNGQIQNDDKNDFWKVQVGQAGYLSADFDLNGQVQNSDKNNFWQFNVGHGTVVPEQVKNTQVKSDDTYDKGKQKTSVTFTFANGLLAGGYYEFDVMMNADAAGTYLGDCQVYIDYNELGFGENIVLNNKILVTKGALLSGELAPSLPLYSIVGTTDNTLSRFAITTEYLYSTSSPTSAHEVPITPGQLMHISLEIADVGQTAGLSFEQSLVDGQTYHSDNTETFSVLATDSDDHTLPVTLSSFTSTYDATEQSIVLNWQTASETDVAGFNVYRADTDDAVSAVIINNDLIQSPGNTTEPQDYSFCDCEGAVVSEYYYWLEVVSLNGEVSLHSSVHYNPEQENIEAEEIEATKLIGAFPNPVRNSAVIKYQIKGATNCQDAVIYIYDIRGKFVKTVQGDNGIAQFDTSDLGQGVYFYSLRSESAREIKKLVVIK